MRRVSRPLQAIRSSPLTAAPTGSYAVTVWAPPRSLAATKGILSFPAGTEMFQFPTCPPHLVRYPGRTPGGLPHSDTSGSLATSASPEHFAAWSRPSSAAGAKASTVRPSSRISLRSSSSRPAPAGDRQESRPYGAMSPSLRWISSRQPHRPDPPGGLSVSSRDDQIRPSLVNVLSDELQLPSCKVQAFRSSLAPRSSSLAGGAAGTRTPDLRRARAALSQLSYGPRVSFKLQASGFKLSPPSFALG